MPTSTGRTPVPDEPGNLPAVPGGAELEELAIGEIVDEPEAARPRPAVVQVITVVVRHEHTRAAGRHAAWVLAGAVVLARRRRQGRTLAERMAQQLAAQGETDKAALLLQSAENERHRRHERRTGTVRTAAELAVLLAVNAHRLLLGAVIAMLAFGMALGDPAWPFHAVHTAAVDLRTVLAWAWRIGCAAGPLGVLIWLHEAGRRAGDLVPKWARTAGEDDIDAAVDELTLTQALANLRIPQIRDYLKLGRPLQFTVGCRQEGRGTYAAIRLPGVPAEKIARRRADLAAGVHRLAKEVWPKTGSEAAILEIWIADKGALEEGAGPYPLLEEGLTDAFKGFPFGRTLRGDPARIPVIGRNTICGGIPEQGKSNGARVVACGYTLDIITELRIYVPDTNFDFEHFEPRCSSYIMGAEDEYVEQILGELEALKDELQRRGQLLVDHEVQEVTREIAHAGVGLHPVFVLLEEAHVVIQHKKFGKDVSGLLCDIVKLDRKRGVHLMVSTQAPTKDNMPRDVTRNCANGIAFAVGDHVANDGLLGQGAYRAGHRATELIPGTDRGTALCKGFSGERSEMVQVHRIDVNRDNNQVTPLVNRALAALAAEERAVPGTDRGPLAIVSRDLLADVAQVIAGPDKVRLADLPARLRKLAPSWGEYRSLSGAQLRVKLNVKGVRTTKAENVPLLDPDDLHRAISARESEG